MQFCLLYVIAFAAFFCRFESRTRARKREGFRKKVKELHMQFVDLKVGCLSVDSMSDYIKR